MLRRYRVHLIGLACLALLIQQWGAGALSTASLWILAGTVVVEGCIGWYICRGIDTFHEQQQRYAT